MSLNEDPKLSFWEVGMNLLKISHKFRSEDISPTFAVSEMVQNSWMITLK
jgi:hypothetical protein